MKYETGTKDEVLRDMARNAIEWYAELIRAHTPEHGNPLPENQEFIDNWRARIRDFRRLAKLADTEKTCRPTKKLLT